MLRGIFLIVLLTLTFSFLSSFALAQTTHTLQCDSDTLVVENLYVNLPIEISHNAACKNITLVNITGISVTFNGAINDFRAVIVRDVVCNFDAATSRSCVKFNADISYVDDQVLISNVSQHFSAGETTSSGRFYLLSHVGSISFVTSYVAELLNLTATETGFTELHVTKFASSLNNSGSFALRNISMVVRGNIADSFSIACANYFDGTIFNVSSMELFGITQEIGDITSSSDSEIYGNYFSKTISNVSAMQLSVITQDIVNFTSSSDSYIIIYGNYFFDPISNVSSIHVSVISQDVANITSSSHSEIYGNNFDTFDSVSSIRVSIIAQDVANITSIAYSEIYGNYFFDSIDSVSSIQFSVIAQDVANITSGSSGQIYGNYFSKISNVSSMQLSGITQDVVETKSSTHESNSECDIGTTYLEEKVSSVIHLRIVNISLTVSGYVVNQSGTIVAGFQTASGFYEEGGDIVASFSNISLIRVSNVSLNVELKNVPANNNNINEPFALTSSSSSASKLMIIGIVRSDDLVDNSCSKLEINRISVNVKVINSNEANLLDRKAQNLEVVASENVNINNSPIRVSLFSQRNGSGFEQVQISSSLVIVPSSLATVTTMIYLSPLANTNTNFNITNNSLTTGSSFVSLYHQTCINKHKKPIFLFDRNSFVDSDDISSQQQQQQNSRILAVYRPVSEIPINFSGTKWIYGSNNDVGACNYFKSSVVREFYKQAHFAQIYDTCGTTSRTQTPFSKSVSKTRSLSLSRKATTSTTNTPKSRSFAQSKHLTTSRTQTPISVSKSVSKTKSLSNIIPKSRTVTQSKTLTDVVAEVIPLPTALIVAAQVTNDVTSFISIGGVSSPISGASAARTNAITSSLLTRVSGFCDSNEDENDDGNSTTTTKSSSSNKKKDQLPPARTVSAFQFKIGDSESAFDIGTVIGNLLLVFVIVPVVFLLIVIIMFKYKTRNMKDPEKKKLPSFSTLVVDSSCLSAHIFFYILYWLPTAAAALKVAFDTSTTVTFRVIVPLLVILLQFFPMSVALVKHFLIHKQIETFVKNENTGSENQSSFCLQLLVNKLINPEGEWKLIKKEQKKENKKKTQTSNTNSVTISSSETPEITITEEDKKALAYRQCLIEGYTDRFRTFICVELCYFVIAALFAEMLFYAFSNPSKGCLAKDVVVLVDTLLCTLLTIRFRPHQELVNKVAVPLLGVIQSGCLLASILGISPDKLAILAAIVASVQIPLSLIIFIGFMLPLVNRMIASEMRDGNNNTDESSANLNSRSTRRRFEQNRFDDDAVELLETPLVVHSPRERSSSSRTHSSSSSSSRNRTSSSKNEREQKSSHHGSSSSGNKKEKEKEKAYASSSSSSSNNNKFKSRLSTDGDDDSIELLKRPLVHSPRESSSSKSSRHHSSSSSSSSKTKEKEKEKEKEKKKAYASSSSSSSPSKTKYNSNSSSSESKKESSSTSSRSRAPSSSSTKQQHSSGGNCSSNSKSSSESQSSSTNNEKETSSKNSNSNKHQSSSSRLSSSNNNSNDSRNKNEQNSNKPTFSSSSNNNNKKQEKSSDSKNHAHSSNSHNSNSNSSDQKKKVSSASSSSKSNHSKK